MHLPVYDPGTKAHDVTLFNSRSLCKQRSSLGSQQATLLSLPVFPLLLSLFLPGSATTQAT